MVSGVRVKRQDTRQPPAGLAAGQWLSQRLLGDGATDTGCGLKAFRRDAFLDLPYFDHMHRFLIALVQREGWKVALCAGQPPAAPDGRVRNTPISGRLLVSVQDLLGVRWLQRRHGGRTEIEEL